MPRSAAQAPPRHEERDPRPRARRGKDRAHDDERCRGPVASHGSGCDDLGPKGRGGDRRRKRCRRRAPAGPLAAALPSLREPDRSVSDAEPVAHRGVRQARHGLRRCAPIHGGLRSGSMSAPDWFDDRLTTPAPRPVVSGWTLKFFRVGLGAAGAFVLGMALRLPRGSTLFGVHLGLFALLAAFAVVVELVASRKRRLYRVGVVALARVVPRGARAFDGVLAVAQVVAEAGPDVVTGSSVRVEYEYPTGPTSRERSRTRTRTDDSWGDAAIVLHDDRFPEGFAPGARFVVLFDPASPSRHVIYHPKDVVRIAPNPRAGRGPRSASGAGPQAEDRSRRAEAP